MERFFWNTLTILSLLVGFTACGEASEYDTPQATTPLDHAPAPVADTIAFAHTKLSEEHADIYTIRVTDRAITRLTTHPADDGQPAWSPDGTHLAFTSRRDGNYEIYRMRADGSDQVNLTNHPADDTMPVWSPDGSRIAFIHRPDVGLQVVSVMSSEGIQVTRLFTTTERIHRFLWSPDSTRLAINPQDQGTVVVDMNGTHQSLIKNFVFPSWSPDGTRLLGSNGQLVTVNADGTNLTSLGIVGWQPFWSPDGTKIAFSLRDDEGDWEIYVANADGSNQRQVTRNVDHDVEPRWSPDGTKLLSISHDSRGFVKPSISPLLRVISVDGTEDGMAIACCHRAGGVPAWQPLPPASSSQSQDIYLPLIQAAVAGQG